MPVERVMEAHTQKTITQFSAWEAGPPKEKNALPRKQTARVPRIAAPKNTSLNNSTDVSSAVFIFRKNILRHLWLHVSLKKPSWWLCHRSTSFDFQITGIVYKIWCRMKAFYVHLGCYEQCNSQQVCLAFVPANQWGERAGKSVASFSKEKEYREKPSSHISQTYRTRFKSRI